MADFFSVFLLVVENQGLPVAVILLRKHDGRGLLGGSEENPLIMFPIDVGVGDANEAGDTLKPVKRLMVTATITPPRILGSSRLRAKLLASENDLSNTPVLKVLLVAVIPSIPAPVLNQFDPALDFIAVSGQLVVGVSNGVSTNLAAMITG